MATDDSSTQKIGNPLLELSEDGNKLLGDSQQISLSDCLGFHSLDDDSNELLILDRFNSTPQVVTLTAFLSTAAKQAVVDATSRPFGIDLGLGAKASVKVLVNPFAGNGSAPTVLAEIEAILKAPGLDLTIIETTRAGHAWEFGNTCDLNEVGVVLFVSGDGLLHEFVNGLMTRRPRVSIEEMPSLGIIPGGSGNGLAKSITYRCGLPLEPWACAYIAVKGMAEPMDLQRYRIANAAECSPMDFRMGLSGDAPSEWRYSFLSLTWGMIADIDIESERMRFLGSMRFDIEAAAKIYQNKAYPGELRYCTRQDNGTWHTIDGPFTTVLASNATHIGYNMHLTPHAHFSNGSVDMIVLKETSCFSLLAMFLDTESGSIAANENVTYLTGVVAFQLVPESCKETCEMRGEDGGHMVIDGEEVVYDAMECELLPGAMRILCLPAHLGDAGAEKATSPIAKQAHLGCKESCGVSSASQTCLDLEAGPEVQKLGLFFSALPPEALVIKRVSPGSWSALRGIEPGYVLNVINGRNVEDLNEDEFQHEMQQRPLFMRVSVEHLLNESPELELPSSEQLQRRATAFAS